MVRPGLGSENAVQYKGRVSGRALPARPSVHDPAFLWATRPLLALFINLDRRQLSKSLSQQMFLDPFRLQPPKRSHIAQRAAGKPTDTRELPPWFPIQGEKSDSHHGRARGG
jgi:hypothetical protein